MEIKISVLPTGKKIEFNVDLEFRPDKIIETESPLDDLRKMIQT